MKHKLKKLFQKLLRPITVIFEDDGAPTHKAYMASIEESLKRVKRV